MQQLYKNRPDYSVPRTLNLDREADQFLHEVASGNNKGRFISSLLLQERARREERQRIAREVLNGPVGVLG